jgi:hypothetical protein
MKDKLYTYSFKYKLVILIAILIIFFCAQFPSDKTRQFLNSILSIYNPFGNDNLDLNNDKIFPYIVGPIKALFFSISLVILLLPIIKVIATELKGNNNKLRGNLKQAGFVFLAISLLVIPWYLKSMGKSYGNLSIDPFLTNYSLLSNRILMPALAFFLQLKGPLLYFFFTLILIFLFTFLLVFWFDQNCIKMKLFFFVSVLTSSFYIFQFQYPGYPDILLYVFFILILIIKNHNLPKLLLFALSLCTHEASLFVLIPYFFLFENPKLFKYIVFVSLIYLTIWVFSFSFDFYKGISSHNLGNEWVLEKVINNPAEYIKGLFFSYKLLWLPILIYPFLLFKIKPKEVIGVILIFLGAILVTLLAVDTSRLIGLSFIGFLLMINSFGKLEALNSKFSRYILIANLIIPSFYYGINTGLVSFPGIYKWVYQLF